MKLIILFPALGGSQCFCDVLECNAGRRLVKLGENGEVSTLVVSR